MPPFIPGLELSRAFFEEVVRPTVASSFPNLRYSAALLGSGSEVLGFDTEMSTDHDWGPRVDLFVADDEPNDTRARLDAALRQRLPYEFRGYPVGFSDPDPNDHGTRLPQPTTTGPVPHTVGIFTIAEFVRTYLGADVSRPLAPSDWVTFPEQKLRTMTVGSIFQDEIGLGAVRDRFAYYPNDVWLYLLVCAWTRIGQEEHLMGRAGVAGDEIGSALIGARLVRDVMRLAFLIEKTYAPYPKWFGTAFARLRCAADLSPHLRAALSATSWQDRERRLVACYERVVAMHNALGITEPFDEKVRPFFGRPFQVIALKGFADAIAAKVEDPAVRRWLKRPRIGSVDQFSDSTDLIANPEWRESLRRLYD